MALKQCEVQHIFLAGKIENGSLESLNAQIAEYISRGWKILDAKVISFDTVNQEIRIFYILINDGK